MPGYTTFVDALQRIARNEVPASVAPASPEPDAQCTVCGEMFFSAEGHPEIALCARCWKVPS